ncbi:DUF4350 domain-containing protein [Phycicoccus avicenniae]|uniref:DUF4350 domain-containing protein n=1 Tax=Phycicoccus avicenniae TaxID=2828860 RepID=UPI003D270527
MSATTTTDAPGVSAAGVDGRRVVRRTRGIVLWVAVLVVGGFVIALVAGSPSPEDYLHPDGTGQSGTRALVEVLRDQGIDVEVVSTADEAVDAAGDGRGTTVVVGNSDLLTDSAAARLLSGTRSADGVVFLDGAPGVLDSLGLGLSIGVPAREPAAADCSLPWVDGGDHVTRLSWAIVPSAQARADGARGCYPVGDPDAPDAPVGFAAVEVPSTTDRAPVTVLGMPDAATNRFVTEADHAGLVVRLLGASPRLVWYHPDYEDTTENPPTTEDDSVWPAWVGPGLVLLALAFVAFALARGRRLGRLVPEPLPVVVRATETTESRAELYRASGDRVRAARVLRQASAARLAVRLGLPARTPTDGLVPAVAAAAGLPTDEVDALLRAPAPLDEAGLVTLAQQLAHLEEKVRSS